MAAVAFRPLTRADFPLLRAWLEDPVVHRWWNHETGDAALERDFGPAVDGKEPGQVHVASLDGTRFGLIQRYAFGEYPEYIEEMAPVYPTAPSALSIDYLIGDPAHRGRGLGAAMIAAYVEESWAAYPGATEIVVPVAKGNTGSWRALERAGFTRVAEVELEPDNPIDPPDHVVYRLERPGTLG